jgi:DNA-binding Lrp family transcriptional regulator
MPLMSEAAQPSPAKFTPLDEGDLKIIQLLGQDGRMSGREIAQKSGLSEANVSRRLARLMDEGSLRVLGLVAPATLGLRTRAILLIRCKGDPADTAQRLARFPSVHWCGSSFGDHDVILYATVRDEAHLISLVDDIFAADENLEDISICPVLEAVSPNSPLGGEPRAMTERSVEARLQSSLDDVDLALIRVLQRNGRASFAELADASGISATSAADRFRRLQSEGIVQILALPLPVRIGNLVHATACIRVRGSIRSVMRAAASLPGSLWTVATAGAYSVIMDFACPNEHAMNETRARLLAAPGVTGVSLSLHRTKVKDDMAWGFEDEPASA